MSTNPTITHYWDHHKVIKAIEKCSLQATFGPEIISTRDFLPRKSEVSSGITFKASNDSTKAPVKEHARFNGIPSLLAKPRANVILLPIDPPKKDGNIAPDLIPKNSGKRIVPTNRRGNIPSELFTSSYNMPAVSAFESGTTPIVQSDFLRQVPQEAWGHRVSYYTRTPPSVILADFICAFRLKSFEVGPARSYFIAISMICHTQISSIQTTTVSGTRRTSSASVARRTL